MEKNLVHIRHKAWQSSLRCSILVTAVIHEHKTYQQVQEKKKEVNSRYIIRLKCIKYMYDFTTSTIGQSLSTSKKNLGYLSSKLRSISNWKIEILLGESSILSPLLAFSYILSPPTYHRNWIFYVVYDEFDSQFAKNMYLTFVSKTLLNSHWSRFFIQNFSLHSYDS